MKMRRFFLLGMSAAALTFGLVLAGCDKDIEPSDETETITYTSTDTSGARYALTLTIADDTTYKLEVTKSGVTRTSTGSAAVSVSTITLKPSGGGEVSVTISGGGMTAMSGTITFDDGGDSVGAPASLTPKIGGLALDPIAEPATGQASITVTNAAITGTPPADGTSYSANVGGLSNATVSGGKLSFTLGTPSSGLAAITELNGKDNGDVNGSLFGMTTSGYALTISDLSAQYLIVSNFSNNGTAISREAWEADGKTYFYGSFIVYVYVNKNVTLTRAAKDIPKNGHLIPYAAINLPLKTGWNLVQFDTYEKPPVSIVTVKIAGDDVPWNSPSRRFSH
jgi:hypothetical protein